MKTIIDKKSLLEKRYESIYSYDWLKNLAKTSSFAFRINTFNISQTDFCLNLDKANIPYEIFTEKTLIIPFSKKDFISHELNRKNNLGFILNLSSIIPPFLINPEDGDNILDFCAAPGIKSALIYLQAYERQIKVNLSVIEKDLTRYTKMKKLFQDLFNNDDIKTINIDSRSFRQDQLYDKILCDVPCSAEGEMIIQDNYNHWSSKLINSYTNTQKALIAKATSLLKIDGTLIYSTCTLSPEENEEILNWAKQRFDIKIENIVLPNFLEQSLVRYGIDKWSIKTFNSEVSNSIRIKPGNNYEGFFIAKIKKLS